MDQAIEKYVSLIESQKKKAVADLERARRAISRLDEKLADPERYYRKENGRAKKVAKLFEPETEGETPKKQNTILKKKSEKPVVELEEVKGNNNHFEKKKGFWD